MLQICYRILLLVFFYTITITFSYSQIVDPTFISPFNENSFIREIAVQPDGKVLVAGRLYNASVNGGALVHLLRLQSNGNVDESFSPGVLRSGDIYAVRVLNDGRIILGGYFSSYNNMNVGNLVRLHPDGNIDSSFDSGSGLDGANNYIKDIYLLNSNKLLIGGMVTRYNKTASNLLVQVNADGSLDQSFTAPADYTGRIETIEQQADKKILIGGGIEKKGEASGRKVLLRLNETGSLDEGFLLSKTNIPSINRILVQPDGKILVGGDFDRYNDTAFSSLVRLHNNGAIDKSFITNAGFKAIHGGIITYPLNIVADIKLQQEKILVCGNFFEYNGIYANGLIKLNSDGSVNETFQACKADYSFNGTLYGITLLPNDQLLVAGMFSRYVNVTNANAIARLNGSPGQIPAVNAAFDYIIQGRELIVQNQSGNAKSYYWDFGEGPSARISNPTYVYSKAGSYNVKLYAYGACNTQQVITKTVNIVDLKSIAPNIGGNTGTVTVKIAGAGFTSGSAISLVRGGKEIKGINMTRSTDGNFVNVTFELYDVAPGVFDLVISNGLNRQVLENGFTVTQGIKPVINTSIIGRDIVRTGTQQRYSFVISNQGNIDAKGVILWIALPVGSGFKPVNFTMVSRKEDSVMLEDNPPMYFTVDSLFDGPEPADVLGMMVRNIPAHGTVNFDADITLQQTGSIHSWTSSPMYGSPKNKESGVCQDALNSFTILTKETIVEGVKQLNSIVKSAINCGQSAYDLVTELFFFGNNLLTDNQVEWRKVGNNYEVREYQGERKEIDLGQWSYDGMLNNEYTVNVLPVLAKTTWECLDIVVLRGRGYYIKNVYRKLMNNLGSNASGAKKIVYTVIKAIEKRGVENEVDVLTILNAFDKAADVVEYIKLFGDGAVVGWKAGACVDWLRREKVNTKWVNVVASYDPNEKVGPPGSSDSRFSQALSPFNYKIYFENKSSATAPAQEIRIIDTLDKSVFDLNAVELESFKLGTNAEVLIPGGLKEYSYPLIIKRSGKRDILVRFYAKLDSTTGILTFRFISLDPRTNELIDDPLDGLLPPNKLSPEGEGYVAFKVRPKSNLSDGSSIRNQALIYFDNNEPIYTNIYQNKVDKIKPVSRINVLPASTSDSVFTLSWSGTDVGSGISSYNIYYSVNGGTYNIWQFDVADEKTSFKGSVDSTYRFFSISKDKAGNIEDVKTTPEATISIVPGGDRFIISSFGVTCKNANNGKVSIQAESKLQYQAMLILGNDTISKAFTEKLVFENCKAGIYKLCIARNQQVFPCYEISIIEPKDLSVYPRVISGSLSLRLDGADEYQVYFNQTNYKVDGSEILLPLQQGINNLLVKTNNACQGTYTQQVNYSGRTVAYPNPVDDVLTILPVNLSRSSVHVAVYNANGFIVFEKTLPVRNGQLLIDMKERIPGMYTVRLLDEGNVQTLKIIKR